MTSPSTDEMRISVCEKLLGFVRSDVTHGSFWYWPKGYITFASRPYAELHELPPLTLDWLWECVQYLRKSGDQFQWLNYQSILFEIVWGRPPQDDAINGGLAFDVVNATAEQRLRALYLTIKG